MKNVLTVLTLMIYASISADTSNAQWVQQKSGTNEQLTDVIMLDTATAIAVGRNGSILRTTNAGTTWIDEAAPLSYGAPWNSVSFLDTTHGIIVGDGGVVFTTYNGGESRLWHQIPGRRKCLSAFSVGPGSFYVGADSGWVYKTSDTGRTWSSEKISEYPIRSLFKYRGATPLIGVSKFALTSHSICTQYVVPPPSWGESILANFQGLGSEAFDAEFCNGGYAEFIVGVQGDLRSAPIILRKTLSGTEWSVVSSGILRDGSFFSVSAPSVEVIYVCGSGGMIYRSSNGGDTWLDQSVKTMRNVKAIFFFDERHGFAVGDSGMILHTLEGGPTSVAERGGFASTKVVLDQNYPNPFNPATNISFVLPSSSFVSLKVFDLLGREVASIVSGILSAGNYSRQWNAAGMPSGVYLCRLRVGSFAETKKLILLE